MAFFHIKCFYGFPVSLGKRLKSLAWFIMLRIIWFSPSPNSPPVILFILFTLVTWAFFQFFELAMLALLSSLHIQFPLPRIFFPYPCFPPHSLALSLNEMSSMKSSLILKIGSSFPILTPISLYFLLWLYNYLEMPVSPLDHKHYERPA